MFPRLMRILCVSGLIFIQNQISGHDPHLAKAVAATVQLDSVVIVATRHGFSVEDFIRLVQTDESLYRAFHNLRRLSYLFDTSMKFTDRRNKLAASYISKNAQVFDGRCRSMQVLNEKTEGDFFKGRKQKHRYYTYSLYDRVFLTHGTVCLQPIGAGQAGAANIQTGQSSAMERQINELENLIFRPGTRSYVPFIGRKTEIFSDDMRDMYDFSITSGTYQGKPAYIFTAKVRDIYVDRENKTVFKELITYFLKEDFQVMARKYTLSQRTALYMFDVTMQVDLLKWNDLYVPEKVTYDGTWNIPTKKRETGSFTVEFSQFQ